jgi:hypothetical protein
MDRELGHEDSSANIDHALKMASYERRQKPKNALCEAVGTNIFSKRVEIQALREKFPMHPGKWDVTTCFSFLKGGPLYVDEVGSEEEALNLGWKRAFMKERGFRYIIVTPKSTVVDILNDVDDLNS